VNGGLIEVYTIYDEATLEASLRQLDSISILEEDI
jgi:hypothetical protein